MAGRLDGASIAKMIYVNLPGMSVLYVVSDVMVVSVLSLYLW